MAEEQYDLGGGAAPNSLYISYEKFVVIGLFCKLLVMPK